MQPNRPCILRVEKGCCNISCCVSPVISKDIFTFSPLVKAEAKENDPSLARQSPVTLSWVHGSSVIYACVCNWVLIKSVSGACVIVCFQDPPCVSLCVIGCYRCCECTSGGERATGQVTVWLQFGKCLYKCPLCLFSHIFYIFYDGNFLDCDVA